MDDGMLIDFNRLRRNAARLDANKVFNWRARCSIKVLLVTDGLLDFGMGDFSLGAFVRILKDRRPFYADFQLTLAHLRIDLSPDLMEGAPEVHNSIRGFRFDNPAHFAYDMYDEMWLFGFETNFHQPDYGPLRNSVNSPSDKLSDTELLQISRHMADGRGVFATGDHGKLGKGLCGSVLRVRNMRHWDTFNGSTDDGSMIGPRRNDTTDKGNDAGSQFSDQSDDIPQRLILKLYSTQIGHLKSALYPHPVLCGTSGRIDVFPDHPHEGECKVPSDLSLDAITGGKEYPEAIDGTGQVMPEVIATSNVPAGNVAQADIVGPLGMKYPTDPHSFGAISAYDGHRAVGKVGRVICDSTWHHFVNVNLIGVIEGGFFDQSAETDENGNLRPWHLSKADGFLFSPSGRAALAKIKNYYTNIAVWIAPSDKIKCFGKRFWWEIVYNHRIMEAALSNPDADAEKIPLKALWSIGVHARDVIGVRTSQCQTTEWIIAWIENVWPEILPWIDPWRPLRDFQKLDDGPMPVIDPMPLVDIALGAAIVAMRQMFPFPPKDLEAKFDDVMVVAEKAARSALDRANLQTEILIKNFTATLPAATK